ncbi:MAG: efflux RND transporter permease subunit, partial [Geobacteraceae bacterium]|nr:efflux RND transporter permease subunit [Geobacteraceae bacterium]
AADYRDLVISYKAGSAVRLADVASVEDSVEDLRVSGFVNGAPAVMVIIFRQPGVNIIDTVDNIRALLPQLSAAMPGGVKLSVVLDRTPPIRGSLHDVEISLLLSGVLVVLVVFWFLRNVRATMIPAVAVTSSIIGTFAVMYLFGYSLDNLSLMALTIATGFVVDDAIVVLENVTRYREMGQSPLQAALNGSKEIAFTVLSMSVSLVAVFIPILLMGGMVGRLFREFAVTLSAAIMVSLVVSLTVTPMMCATVLKDEAAKPHGRIYRASESLFTWMHSHYETSLRWSLDHRRIMIGVMMATVALSISLFVIIPKGFFPEQDTGRIAGSIQAAQDISFQAMRAKLIQIVGIIKQDPDVEYVIGFTGGGGGSTVNSGRMFISLQPFAKRKSTARQVIARLRKKLAHIPGAPTFLQPVQDLRVGGRISNALYQYTLQGENVTELNSWSQRVLQRMRTLPGLVDVSSDQQNGGLEADLVIDRPTASRLGIAPQQIDEALYDAFGQRQVSVIYTPLNQYHVVMEAAPAFWQQPDTLRDIHVLSSTGQMVPLSAFTSFKTNASALAVNHQSQFPAVTTSFNLAPGVSLGKAVATIEKATREMGMPASIRGRFAGTAQAFQDSLKSQPLLILAALLAVYIVLGILYESYIHPLTILSTLPSAGVGAVAALMMFRSDLNLIAIIGVILLIGIVKKNGILMVDFALAVQRREGKTPREAIYEACLLRFRPIMMTTMAALFGALPLALGTGIGSELRRPLGIAIVGGLLFSQMMTLYTTPVVYLYLDRFRMWVDRKRNGQRAGAKLDMKREVS